MFDGGLPVIFGDYIQHAAIHVRNSDPTSAGRFTYKDGKVTITGKSIGLPHLPPVEGDDKIIQRVLETEL
jgi:hypothetical protein